jgi:probable metal-binding protein
MEPNSTHGHEVMRMMLEAVTPYTPAGLEAAIHERFGPNARFHTCSAQGLNARELIAFLDRRGKFLKVEGGLKMETGNICDHGE